MGPLVVLFFLIWTVSQHYFKKANNLPQLHRDVFLIRYKSHLFPSHWAIFVPNRAGHHVKGTNAGPGKVIHVEGDVNVGFNLHFKRNYDPLESSKTMEVEFLASIDDTLVVNPTDPTFCPEQDQALPGDKLEQIALSVQAPQKTLGVRASCLGTHICRSAHQLMVFHSRMQKADQFTTIANGGRRSMQGLSLLQGSCLLRR